MNIEKINDFITFNFDKIEINVIQCKTNWNDNAQIPMLWDMIYKVKYFDNNNIRRVIVLNFYDYSTQGTSLLWNN